MKTFAFLFVFCVTIFLAQVEAEWRIINGTNAIENQFPYQVSLQYLLGHQCGGSIIHPRWILTAAHCLGWIVRCSPKRLVSIMVGSNSLSSATTYYHPSKYVLHNGFQEGVECAENDIALIKLTEEIQFTDSVGPIDLETRVIDSGPAVVSGWGYVNPNKKLPDRLKYLNTEIVPCMNDKIVCAQKDHNGETCGGDSGGPLVANNKLVGVLSYGDNTCDGASPDKYTRVSYYYDWIQGQIAQDS